MAHMLTSKGRLSYPNLFKPVEDENGVPFYSCTLLLPHRDTLQGEPLARHNKFISDLEAEIDRLIASKWPKRPAGLKTPILPQTDEAGVPRGNGCVAGAVMIRTKTKEKIQVVHRGQVIIEEDKSEVYPGRWCRLMITPSVYDFQDSKTKATVRGVTLYLNGVELLGHGERLAGAPPALKMFQEYALTDEDTGDTEEAAW